MTGISRGLKSLLSLCYKAIFSHDTFDCSSANADSFLLKLFVDTATAVTTLFLEENFFDSFGLLLSALAYQPGSLTNPAVISAHGNFEQAAHQYDRVFVPMLTDKRVL